jgi:hypothetical protein
MTRVMVGHHRKAMSLPLPTHTSNERHIGEERTLTRCSLCPLVATDLAATRVGGMEMAVPVVLGRTALMATVAVQGSMESRVRVGMETMDLAWVMARPESSSNTTTAPTKDVNGQEVFDLSYTMTAMINDWRLAVPSPSFLVRTPGPTDCYAPTTT